uniref:MICAL-like protein 1 n=1 Tax=Gouania willdenowi TaxID=441366 RepID=A0A8C5DM02_GOUWI
MGSLKALQEWCRIQCENYDHVDVKDMSASFRDGLAFCAIIHRYRPDLIDFGSLSKENVYENNRLAFEVAETQLGIPALLDPEDMVSMKVPDRLSIITYVSQYYNFFNNKPQANPPSMKRLSSVGLTELAPKRPPTPLEDAAVETKVSVNDIKKKSTLSSTCTACHEHVHLVQRILVDGKLYHRNCFRCIECRSTLLPGSYSQGATPALWFVHITLSRHASSNQNGQPDLSTGSAAGVGRSTADSAVAPKEEQEETTSVCQKHDIILPLLPNLGKDRSRPPGELTVCFLFIVFMSHHTTITVLSLLVSCLRVICGELCLNVVPPSLSVSSLFSGSHKPKDPPWLALVQSEPKKKKSPSPSPCWTGHTPNTGSLSSLNKGEDVRPSTPPHPANPFEDDDEVNDDNEEEGGEGGAPSTTVVANHPWYSITQATDPAGAETPPTTGSSSRSVSSGSSRRKKRPAPRVPQPPTALSPSQPSSCSPSPALSTDSLSSGSDLSSSHVCLGGGQQEQAFTKSVSEPSICSPCDSAASPTSFSNEHIPHSSPNPFPAPSNTSSAPATPQTSRNPGTKGPGAPPRPNTTPSPLAAGAAQAHNKVWKRCNPFNRKGSPSPAKSTRSTKGPRPARPPAPGHGFPLIKRKVQSDQFIPVEDIHGEMSQLEKQLDELEHRGVELEKKLRENPNDEDEEHLLVDWFTLIHDKHLLVRREAELVYTAKQQNLEERQADVEYELRCLLNKPEKDWSDEDKSREQQLMAELVTIIEQRNQIVNTMDQDRQRGEEEDKVMEEMLKKKGNGCISYKRQFNVLYVIKKCNRKHLLV